MRIYVLDDEPVALRGSVKIIQETEPDAEIMGFGRAKAVFKHITESGEHPDVVFSDIEMPGINGLEFAVRLKQMCPQAILIFVTAYSQYALDAFRLHVHGYILKPLRVDRVREELDHALKKSANAGMEARLQDVPKERNPQEKDRQERDSQEKNQRERSPQEKNQREIDPEENHQREERIVFQDSDDFSDIENQNPKIRNDQQKLQVRCFGYFEVFWKGVPLMFSRRQTKELLAYLIDRRGAACTAEEIAAALWEDEDNMKNLKSRIRILISDLKRILGSIGKEDIILRRSGQIAIKREEIDCDYYRMLAGDMDAVNAFRGEYMVQYSWAEVTAGQLHFEK